LRFGLPRRISLKAIENAQSLGLPNLIRFFAGWSPFPLGVVLTLTGRCNLNCDMCLQVEERQGGMPELALDELKGVVDDLARSFRFKPFVHLTGGEPLLRRDLLSLLAYIKERGFSCSLTTNGLLLQGHAQSLVRLGLDRLHVSLDGPAEIHDAVRGIPGAFDRTIEGIKALVAARTGLGVSCPAVTINTVISETNLPQLEAMILIAKNAGADGLSFQHLMFSSCVNQDLMPQDVDHLLSEIPGLKRKAKAAGLPLTFYPHMSEKTLRVYYTGSEDALKRRCIFPWYVVRVDTLGNISPCWIFVADNIKTKQASFREVWNSRRYREFRRELAKRGVFADCGRCCHRQY
jgi:radical SAM protein with 4Fe4S-binding SPASM domain